MIMEQNHVVSQTTALSQSDTRTITRAAKQKVVVPQRPRVWPRVNAPPREKISIEDFKQKLISLKEKVMAGESVSETIKSMELPNVPVQELPRLLGLPEYVRSSYPDIWSFNPVSSDVEKVDSFISPFKRLERVIGVILILVVIILSLFTRLICISIRFSIKPAQIYLAKVWEVLSYLEGNLMTSCARSEEPLLSTYHRQSRRNRFRD